MFGRTFSGDAPGDRSAEPLFRNAQPAQAGAALRPAAPAASASELPASRPRTPVSTLSTALRLEGDLIGEADVQIDGFVKGDVRVSRLVVGPNARIEGAVRAQHVEVRGRVHGAIEAQIVRLHDTAHVEGDITHGSLAIESGAHFEGRVQPLPRAAAAEPQAAAPHEAPAAEVHAFPVAEEPAGEAAPVVTAA